MKLNKTFLTMGLAAALLQMPASSFAQTAGGNRQNPLLTKSSLPFGAPDFSKIQESDYLPAIEAAIREQRANIQKIVNNKKKPNFQNTILAYEESGALLEKVTNIFFGLTSAHKTPGIAETEKKVTPLLTELDNEISFNKVEERYISLLTDFGFKRIFGTAMNKDLLICFLNSLFNGKQVVKDVKYLNPEHVGDVYADRKAIFDVYCEGENGEKFIVEMQNAYQTYFKDRSLFYSTFPIREQAPKGKDWDFKLNHVYTVALLNFDMNEDAFEKEKIRHSVQLCDTATHKVFYNKLEFIYVEIAKFDKSLEELETLYDKWLYALKNLYKLTQRPKELCDKVFDRLFEEAEISKFTQQELREYEASKMAYRDIKNSVDTAKREGIAEGITQRNFEIARKMLAKGMNEATVLEITGLSAEEIQLLKAEM